MLTNCITCIDKGTIFSSLTQSPVLTNNRWLPVGLTNGDMLILIALPDSLSRCSGSSVDTSCTSIESGSSEQMKGAVMHTE